MFWGDKLSIEDYEEDIIKLENHIRRQKDNMFDIYEKGLDPVKLSKYIDKLEVELEKLRKKARRDYPEHF